jgi:hypothetical protein
MAPLYPFFTQTTISTIKYGADQGKNGGDGGIRTQTQ